MSAPSFRPCIALFVLCLGLLIPAGDSDLASDRAALLALRAAVGDRSLLWNSSLTSPCSWQGVTYSRSRVVELHLPGMGLSGQLPSGVIGNLTELHTLSLRYNALSKSLPSDLAKLSSLRNLYLQRNFFSGDIPAFLFTMQNLVRLNLAGNNISGEISPNFSNLTRLATLYLEENQLNGSIPELNLKLDQLNVSSNQLHGLILSKLSVFPWSSFGGNLLCDKPLKSCNGTAGRRKKLSGGAIAGIVIGSVIGILLIILLLICVCRRKRNKENPVSREVVDPKQVSEKSMADSGGVAALPPPMIADTKSKGNKELVFLGKAAEGYELEV